MIGIVVLFAASVAEGFLLGYFCFHWLAISVSGLILAPTIAWVLQVQGFSMPIGMATAIACLTANQFAFLAGAVLKLSRETTDDE